MSPYIVTVKRPREVRALQPSSVAVSRHTVATLEEARDYIVEETSRSALDRHEDPSFDEVDIVVGAIKALTDTLAESGGTVGPLPDGTLIDVERQPMREDRGRPVDARDTGEPGA